MPYFSDDIIEEVRSRNDIVDVIGQYVHLTKKGSTYFGLCPFHNEKTGSFSVSPNKQMYYCFGCGAGGNVFTFLMQYENFTFPEAMQELADRVGIELPKQEMTSAQRREADRRTQLLEINKEAAKYFYMLLRGPRGQRAHEYFKKRELSDETMQKFGLGYSDQYSDDLYKYLRSKGYDDEILKETGLVTIDEVRGGHDKFWNRAMFPIMDVHNRVIGFGGRVMGDGEPKYLNSSETKIFDKSRNLYGLNIARSTRKNQLLLCEGYMDVIALHQAGFDNAVATLGTALTEEQARLISQYAERVVLAYDSAGPGQAATKRAMNIFDEVGVKVSVLSMTGAKDPDEFIKKYGTERFAMLLDNSRNPVEFELSKLRTTYDTAQADGKVGYLKEACKLFAGIRNPVEREVYITQTANELAISPQAIKAQIENLDKRESYRQRKQQRADTNIYIGRMAAAKDDLQRRTNLRYAMAEEGVLFCLMKNPDSYPQVSNRVSEQDFVTDINRQLYLALSQRLEQGQTVEMIDLSSQLSPELMGRISAIMATAPSQRCDEQTLGDYIARLIEHRSVKTEREVAQMDDNDLGEYVKQLAAKKNRRS